MSAGDPFLGFSPGTFLRRRSRVMEELDGGAMLLPSAPLRHSSRDTEYRYRPDSELFYLTGCTEPDVVALFLDTGEEDRFHLFVPRRDPRAELWTGPRMGPDEAGEVFGADAVHSRDQLEERLPKLLKGAGRIFFRLGNHPPVQRLVVEALEEARARGQRKGTGPRSVVDPGEILDELRLRKDDEEIERLRRAAAVTVQGFREAMAGARPGMGEWEVESLLEASFRRQGAQGPAFPTIAASGANGCILHYSSNADTLGPDDLLLLDGGAQVDLYAGDVTRTFPPGGRFAAGQRAVYEVVLAAHDLALEALRPGVPVKEVHGAAVGGLVAGLVELGVLRGDTEELVAREAHKEFFPHRTSHWLGLDVHDPGDYATDGEPRLLEPGMVLTVEPGLYVPPGSEVGEAGRFQGIGVRIEDDVLVTEDGHENLTAGLPTSIQEIR